MTELLSTGLPLRFYASPSVAKKWQSLSYEQKHALFDEFQPIASNFSPEYGRLRHDFKLCTVPDGLDKMLGVSSLANYAARFAQFLQLAARKLAPVRGELELCAEWAARQGKAFELEVRCAIGRVDVVFYGELLVVEAKLAGGFKHALGQTLAYRECFRLGGSPRGGRTDKWQAQLLMLGKADEHDFRLQAEICVRLDVAIVYYSGQDL